MEEIEILKSIEKQLKILIEKVESLERIIKGGNEEDKCNKCMNQYDSERCVGCSIENNFKNFKSNWQVW